MESNDEAALTMQTTPRSGLARAFSLAFVALAALLLWRFFGPHTLPSLVESLDADAQHLWRYPYFEFGRLAVTPSFLTKSLFFLLFLALVSRSVRRSLRARLLAHNTMDRSKAYAVAQVASYLVFFFGLMAGVEAAGLDLSAFAVFGGALGIGIGFGLQSVANNFISGLVLLADGAVKVGDRIEIGDLVGNVVRIGARATWVETNGSRVVVVPNSELASKALTNWTANERRTRFSLIVGVPYECDLHKAIELLLKAANRHPETLAHPPSEVACTDFAS
ncbi:MAG: mechanosensitive ion channel, partial [Acidobacteria bacterium]|nr:mechanosensitive ion channel [Acidobacteriota bacterium]